MAFPKIKSLKKRFPSFSRKSSSSEVEDKNVDGNLENRSGSTAADNVGKGAQVAAPPSRPLSLVQSVKKDMKAVLNRVKRSDSSVRSKGVDVSSNGSTATRAEEEEEEEVLKGDTTPEAVEQQQDEVEPAVVQDSPADLELKTEEQQQEAAEVVEEDEASLKEEDSPVIKAASVPVVEEEKAVIPPPKASSSSSYAGLLAVVLLSAVAVGAVVVLRVRAVARK